jgi:hypothetical protein
MVASVGYILSFVGILQVQERMLVAGLIELVWNLYVNIKLLGKSI